jgi:hypothetical protein
MYLIFLAFDFKIIPTRNIPFERKTMPPFKLQQKKTLAIHHHVFHKQQPFVFRKKSGNCKTAAMETLGIVHRAVQIRVCV